jgi:toxin ParE1/3/4
MRLRISEEAEEEARAAAQWYEQRREGLGQRFLEVLVDAFGDLELHPRRYPRLAGLGGRREVRRFLLSRFPYSIVYEVRPAEITVLAVAHVKRRPGYWRNRLFS